MGKSKGFKNRISIMSGLKEPRITKLSLLIEDREVTWSVPYNDVTATELLEAFIGLLVTQTFIRESILGAMEEYLEDHKIYNKEYED